MVSVENNTNFLLYLAEDSVIMNRLDLLYNIEFLFNIQQEGREESREFPQ